MWLEVAAGAALVFAGWWIVSGFLAKRSTKKPDSDVQRFTDRFIEEIGANHPHVEVRGMVPGRFAVVIAIHGQELPISLHALFRRCSAFPDSMSDNVARLLTEIEDTALEHATDHVLSDVAAEILPQIRSVEWLRARGAVFGESALVHRELAEGLVICYVIDDPWCMTFVCRAHLDAWGLCEQDLYHLATRNLHELADRQVPVPDAKDEGLLVRTGDGFDAARVLLLDPDETEGLLVALPERDLLWVGNDHDTHMSRLMNLTEQQSQSAQHPISAEVYRMTEGQLVPVKAAGTGS